MSHVMTLKAEGAVLNLIDNKDHIMLVITETGREGLTADAVIKLFPWNEKQLRHWLIARAARTELELAVNERKDIVE